MSRTIRQALTEMRDVEGPLFLDQKWDALAFVLEKICVGDGGDLDREYEEEEADDATR